MKMSETMPVPMVTENHDGEKLRTTRRQPVSFLFDAIRSGRVGEAIAVEVMSGLVDVRLVSLLLARGLRRMRCAAVLVTAGLSIARCHLGTRKTSKAHF